MRPCTPVTHNGLFERLNVKGNLTGVMAFKQNGEAMLGAPRDLTWRPLSELSVWELRARAVRYREMAETATTAQVMNGLLNIAGRLDNMADQREGQG